MSQPARVYYGTVAGSGTIMAPLATGLTRAMSMPRSADKVFVMVARIIAFQRYRGSSGCITISNVTRD